VPTILAIEEEVEIRKSGFKASLAPPQKKVSESPSQKKKKLDVVTCAYNPRDYPGTLSRDR
jgi:hypothetical protein